MNTPTPDIAKPAATTWFARFLGNPFARIFIAIGFIAIPIVVISTAFNLFVENKAAKRAGAILLAAAVVAAYCLYVRKVEKREISEFSLDQFARELIVGVLGGIGLICITIGILASIGVYSIDGANGWLPMLATVPAFIFAGFFEEILLRAIIFRILEQRLGTWIALAISAAIFGFLHLFNPGATVLNALSVMIEAGILLAAAYMLTRRLWLCIGLHIGWNFAEGGIFSAAVSGGTAKGYFQSTIKGADWLSGGAFGVEASVVALIVCTAAGIAILAVAIKKGRVVQPTWKRSEPGIPV
jgi:membrane protease YdiL (CAAX protease family)